MIFDRFRGVLPLVSGEGTHFLIPWVQKPIIFSIRSRPRRVPVVTGSKGQSKIIIIFNTNRNWYYSFHSVGLMSECCTTKNLNILS